MNTLTKHTPSHAFCLLGVRYFLRPRPGTPARITFGSPHSSTTSIGGHCTRSIASLARPDWTGMGCRRAPSIPFARKSPPLSLFWPWRFALLALAFRSPTLALSLDVLGWSCVPCLVVVRRVIGPAPARTGSSAIVGIAGVAVVIAARVLIVTTATFKSVGMYVNTTNQGRDRA
jgi:hypothetical protein